MSQLALELIEENRKTQSPILDLGNCNLKSLPDELLQCVWLESLNLSEVWTSYKWYEEGMLKTEKTSSNRGKRNRLFQIPNLSPLTKLKKLILSEAFIQNLDFLEGLDNLECLDLSSTYVSNIGVLKKLKNLKCLIVSDCNELSDLKPLGEHIQLEVLVADNTAVMDLLPISSCIALKYLDLSGTKVSELMALSGLKGLNVLKLISTGVSEILQLETLESLHDLSLSNTTVSNVDSLQYLTNLRTLDLSDTQIKDCGSLVYLYKLDTLKLANTKIEDLTPLSQLVNLSDLDLSQNDLISDLSPIQSLINLCKIKLNISNINDLTVLGRLPNLEKITLNSNAPKDLEPLIPFIQRIIHSTPGQYPSITQFLSAEQCIGGGKEGDDELMNVYFGKLFNTIKRPGMEAKALIIGESQTGKTTLYRLFFPAEQSENVIRTGVLPCTYAKDSLFKLNIFDFEHPDPELIPILYRVFHSNEGFTVLVLREQEENSNRFAYWRQLYYDVDKNSPTLVLDNRSKSGLVNGIKVQVLDVSMLPQFNFAINLGDSDSASDLKSIFELCVKHLPILRKEIPLAWDNFRLQVASNGKPYISMDEFDALFKHPLNSTLTNHNYVENVMPQEYGNDARECLKYLTDIGVCYHKNKTGLRNFVITDLNWLANQIITILNTTKANGGYWEYHHESGINFGELLNDLEIYFPIGASNGSSIYFNPVLLPMYNSLDIDETYNYSTKMLIEFEYLPKRHFYRYFSDNIKKTAIRGGARQIYRNGVVLQSENFRTHVVGFLGQRQNVIQISIYRDNKTSLDYLLRYIDEIIESLCNTEDRQLIQIVKIPCTCRVCSNQTNKHHYEYFTIKKLLASSQFKIQCYLSGDLLDIESLLVSSVIDKKILPNENLDLPLKAFVVYSEKDKTYLEDFQNHISFISKKIVLWDDSKIPPGEEWDKEITKNLTSAKIIFFLISADMFSTEYVWKKEIPKAIERHENRESLIIPIFIHECHWEGHELAKCQGLPRKTDKHFYIGNMESDGSRNKLWKEVIKEIDQLVVKFTQQSS